MPQFCWRLTRQPTPDQAGARRFGSRHTVHWYTVACTTAGAEYDAEVIRPIDRLQPERN